MTFFFVTDLFAKLFLEGWEEVEGDVGRLELFGFGVSDVVGEGAVGAQPWRRGWGLAVRDGCGKDTGQHAARDRFGVAFDAGELARDHHAGMGLELEGF